MRLITHLTCAILCLSRTGFATADILDTASERAFSLAAGKPAIVLKRGDWMIVSEKRVKDGSLRYELDSEQLGRDQPLVIWLSNARTCSSVDRCLDEQMADQVPGRAKDIERFTAGQFAAVQYHLDDPNGMPGKVSGVFAVARAGDCLFQVRVLKINSWAARVLALPKENDSPITSYPDIAPLIELVKGLQIRQPGP
jgi:hypothetical protein